MSERTELESCISLLFSFIKTDESIWVTFLLALYMEILEVDYRRTS